VVFETFAAIRRFCEALAWHSLTPGTDLRGLDAARLAAVSALQSLAFEQRNPIPPPDVRVVVTLNTSAGHELAGPRVLPVATVQLNERARDA
jgi:hypothetical protein